MGKGARLPKRTKLIAESEHILSSSAIESKQDEDLFMIDVTGDENAYKKKRRELNSGITNTKKVKVASKQEELLIKKLAKKKGQNVPIQEKEEKGMFDIWDEPIQTKKLVIQPAKKQAGIAPISVQTNAAQPTPKQNPKNKYTEQNLKKKQIAVDIAHPGQSYKPDHKSHQEALSQAVQIEEKREEIVKYKKTPISNGMSKETLDVLITHSDDESEEEWEPTESKNVLKKKKEKLTRAQRNAQKRHKERMFLHKQTKKSRQYLHQFNLVKTINKSIDSHEASLEKKREHLTKIKTLEENKKLGTNVWNKVDPLKVASFPVGLSDEVGKESASLRSIIPKGSLLMDRAYSMSDRKMLNLNKKGNFK